MSEIATPTPEQEQRARWDQLLADIEGDHAEQRKRRLAEARARDRWLMPVLWIVVAALLSGGVATRCFLASAWCRGWFLAPAVPLVIQLPAAR